MVFSSLPFLFLFLPAVLLGYYLLRGRARNYFLLLANLIFYAYGEPVYLLLMLASILVNYGAAVLIERQRVQSRKRIVLIAAVALNLAALGWFKYTGLVTDTLRSAGLTFVPSVSVALPIGISFYTFQAMSYVIDVYWGQCRATKNFVDFAAYISLFPQLIAGPIVRYRDVAEQLTQRSTSLPRFSWGVRMFVIGLAKKVLLANQLVLLWETVAADPHAAGTLAAWCGMAAYTLHIYFDFGGYSDMARGLGAMLGFDFCINFDYPYCADSITDFWRRWHISLSSWFRDYVYIPLGGSRGGKGKTARNLMVVWMLTGLWHGAGWNFVFWGFYYGVLLLLEKFVLKDFIAKLPQTIRQLYTLVLVAVGWVFFASPDFAAAGRYLQVLVSGTGGMSPLRLLGWLPIGLVGAVASTPLAAKLWNKRPNSNLRAVLEAALCLSALVLCTAGLVSGSYNPFLYFRF